MIATNYDDVLDQLRAAGLVVDGRLELDKIIRCRVDGRDREKRGWYRLVEWYSPSGETLIVGSFGVWEGAGNNARKIELPKRDGGKRQELTAEQHAAFKRRLAEDRKRIEQLERDKARRAADRAAKAWAQCSPSGESDYLARKCVQAFGVRFSPSGALVIPMLDTAGKIHGLQVIRSRKAAAAGVPEKQYWPAGAIVKGHFHLIGGSPQWILLLAEGYATAAALHQATGYPVAIAFDAGNLGAVAAALRKRYKHRVQVLICADDDILRKCRHCKTRFVLAPGVPPLCTACGKEHGQENIGVAAASTAAVEVGGSYTVPIFPDPPARAALFLDKGIKLTDYNDLAVLREGGGLHVVRSQIEARILELGLRARQIASAVDDNNGAGGRPKLRPIGTVDELMQRFALVYSAGGAVFDRSEHQLVSLKDMADACSAKYLHRTWMESADRQIVRLSEVGFDPSGDDPNITCNLWAGWPTEPQAGQCERLLEMLRHMCSGDDKPAQLYHWVMCWLAYPLQHPGAKMKTTLVLHGPQGTGKNLFFEAIMSMYGPYGRIIDQGAIEDRFNDWASRKLFLIADEVVARMDLYHIKNKLKAFITGEWIRINPKNIAAYDERNHVNMVFLSNESIPLVLEEDDRRHTVIWTPPKREKEFYEAVLAEIRAGGVAALHDHLLHYDCGDFNQGTAPFGTDAKDELINQSLDNTTRFVYALESGDIGSFKCAPALSEEVYSLYKSWCARIGEKHAAKRRLDLALSRKHQVFIARKEYVLDAIVKSPAAFYMFQTEAPDGVPQRTWLGQCVQSFRDAFKEYRGTACD